jgi:hypothetical protein
VANGVTKGLTTCMSNTGGSLMQMLKDCVELADVVATRTQ